MKANDSPTRRMERMLRRRRFDRITIRNGRYPYRRSSSYPLLPSIHNAMDSNKRLPTSIHGPLFRNGSIVQLLDLRPIRQYHLGSYCSSNQQVEEGTFESQIYRHVEFEYYKSTILVQLFFGCCSKAIGLEG